MAITRLTKERLQELLTRRLGLKDAAFYLEKAGNRLVGDIVSPTFKGKRDHERQGLIWDALEAELGADSTRSVGMLLAYTPDEWKLGQPQAPEPRNRKKAG